MCYENIFALTIIGFSPRIFAIDRPHGRRPESPDGQPILPVRLVIAAGCRRGTFFVLVAPPHLLFRAYRARRGSPRSGRPPSQPATARPSNPTLSQAVPQRDEKRRLFDPKNALAVNSMEEVTRRRAERQAQAKKED